ncbi:MAG: LuxR C-terminal-related transcriptional regulator [Acidimicrobiales bacterium]|nr:LuxR C-terminal-related transcriptional regulator [Acidimicrobiales bacterium]
MTPRPPASLDRGFDALASGDWSAAHELFADVLENDPSAEAYHGMAEASWWLGDMRAAVANREEAHTAFCDRGEIEAAAMAALRLAFDCASALGNHAMARGWLSRARRLVEDAAEELLRGHLQLIASYVDDDLASADRLAGEALAIARSLRDRDLELMALSQAGSVLVARGRVEEGLALQGEAMVASLATTGGDLDTVVFTSCNMITSCAHCAAFEQAVQWIRATTEFTDKYGCPFLLAECRTYFGGVLVATGEWDTAATELRAAIALTDESVPVLHRKALASLAELRLAQGRLSECDRLVAGLEDHAETATVFTMLHLERKQPDLAAATARRRLEHGPDDEVERAELLELAGRAALAADDTAEAQSGSEALLDLAASTDSNLIHARGDRLAGLVARAVGRAKEARRRLDAALATFVELEMPFEAASTRRHLAELLAESSTNVAVAEARLALGTFEELGAGREADVTVGLLRDLGVDARRSGSRTGGDLTGREDEVLALVADGLSNPDIADRLYISRKTVEHHVASILRKLGVQSRAEAAAEAVRRT